MRRRTFLGGLSAVAVGTVRGARADRPFEPLARLTVPGATEAVPNESGTTVYLAVYDGFAVVDVHDLRNPEVLAVRRGLLADHEDGPLDGIYDVKVSGDRLLVAGPNHAPFHGGLSGFALYDVSDPANPERVAFHETDHGIHNAYLDGETAYIAGTGAPGEPLVIVDVSGDEPEEVGRWSVEDAQPGWQAVNDSLHQCHDVYVQRDVAYVSFWDAGTWVLDVSDPAAPEPIIQFAGRDPETVASADFGLAELIELPGNSHYVQPNAGGTTLAVGREAGDFPGTDRDLGYGGVTLWDIRDLADPWELTTVYAENDTSHNFGFQGGQLFTSWYAGGVKVYDASRPARPATLAEWADPATTAFWTAKPVGNGFVASSFVDPSIPPEQRRGRPNPGARLFTFPRPRSKNGDSS